VDLGGAGEDLVFEDDLELEETGMATEEISSMDTLLEEGVEDVGEVALEEEAEEQALEEEEEALPVRAAPVAAVEAAGEGMFFRSVAILTSLVLLMTISVLVGISKGAPSAMAETIAGWFRF